MLIRFSVKNFWSFKSETSLSLESTSITEHEESHTFNNEDIKLLKSAVIYGPNASGKSNLIRAMKIMRDLILESSKESNATEEINVTPFLLSTNTVNEPTMFEIEFIMEKLIYRYGFSVDKKQVHEEWLYVSRYKANKREIKLFSRSGGRFSIPKQTFFYKESIDLKEKTRPNALFLSVIANFNGKTALGIQNWMKNFNFISGMRNNSIGFTTNLIKIPEYKGKILKLLKAADIGIEDLRLEEIDIKDTLLAKRLPKSLLDEIKSAETIFSVRKKYNDSGEEAGFEMFNVAESESEGTKKFLALVGPIIDNLENGGVLVIDELDAKLHPLLTKKIVELFNSYDVNQSNSQLIYATHDVTNLNNKQFRRDQLWFVEKDHVGSTNLYSLVDFRDEEDKKIRKDASYSKDYLLGKYGAIPNFLSWERALEENDGES